MVIDRILKVDSPSNRVQETRDDQGRRGGQGQEEEDEKKEKDKFDKGRPFWKRLVSDSSGGPNRSLRTRLAAGEKPPLPLGPQEEASDTGSTGSFEEEVSLTMSQRVLVLWGVLDTTGKPRVPVIITYVAIAAVIAVSTVLIVGML